MPAPRPESADHRFRRDTLERWGVGRCDRLNRVALDAGLGGLIELDRPAEAEARARLDSEADEAVRRHLEDAVDLACAGERTYAVDDLWPHGVVDELDDLLQDLEAHDAREAWVRSGAGEVAAGPEAPRALGEDHAGLAARLDRLRALTRDYAAPGHACAAWRLLYILCLKVDRVLTERIRREEAGPAPQSYGAAGLSPHKVGDAGRA